MICPLTFFVLTAHFGRVRGRVQLARSVSKQSACRAHPSWRRHHGGERSRVAKFYKQLGGLHVHLEPIWQQIVQLCTSSMPFCRQSAASLMTFACIRCHMFISDTIATILVLLVSHVHKRKYRYNSWFMLAHLFSLGGVQ